MGFQSKTYSLSDEVVEAIEQLREKYGSPNKGLRAVLLTNPDVLAKEIHCRHERGLMNPTEARKTLGLPVKQPPHSTTLDAVGPQVSGGKGKISHESYQREMRPKGDKTR